MREYQQLSTLMPPGTLVSYTIRVALVVDFRIGYDSTRWFDLSEEFHCDSARAVVQRASGAAELGACRRSACSRPKGILFASRLAPGGTNLVVYNDMLAAGDLLQV